MLEDHCRNLLRCRILCSSSSITGLNQTLTFADMLERLARVLVELMIMITEAIFMASRFVLGRPRAGGV